MTSPGRIIYTINYSTLFLKANIYERRYQILFDYIKFATSVHRLDHYKNGPYTDHLAAVAARVDRQLVPLAWCHDIIEDHPDALADLRREVSTEFLFQVLLITRRSSETYFQYIQRLKDFGNTPARRVKIADLHANLAAGPSASLAKRYRKALLILEK